MQPGPFRWGAAHARYSYCFVARANERARWFFAGRRLNIYDSGRKTSAAQISEAEAETGDEGLRSLSSDETKARQIGLLIVQVPTTTYRAGQKSGPQVA